MAVEDDADHAARDARQKNHPQDLVQRCAHWGLTLSTAESLTAGALASKVAEVPGASAVLLGGVIAYSKQVKQQVLEVSAELLEAHGAVDPDVAATMAVGAAARCGADIGIATTGVAGPEPHEGKEVGTVYLGLACDAAAAQRLQLSLPADCQKYDDDVLPRQWLAGSLLLNLDGGRAAIRNAAVEAGLKLVEDFLLTQPAGLPESG
ncbi:CinA family protein [Garicola koreensis]|uniref:Nicotinamide-nucleotide amidase n=1 Tax=Garicola koreensis TaxID=1262554 RepID=A0A7W5TQ38_9MICC|nr:CinA family protein [Garicola koreensis]MBB3667650.1 nicotinamide-nucleotide amidase [Garicola koreensis]